MTAAPFIPWDLPADPATVLGMAATFGQVYTDRPAAGRAERHRIYLGQRDGRAALDIGSKLTAESAAEIRRRYRLGSTKRGLAREFGISDTAVFDVIVRRTWKHVS